MWLAQGVTKENCFLREFKQRLTDVFKQDWMADIYSSERCIQYRKLTLVLEPEKYLDGSRQKCSRNEFVRFRLGTGEVSVHRNRYKGNDLLAGNKCPFCPEVEDDGFHICFSWSMYNNIRPSLMKNIQPYQESVQFARFMSSKDDGTIRKIASFLFKAFEPRNAQRTRWDSKTAL